MADLRANPDPATVPVVDFFPGTHIPDAGFEEQLLNNDDFYAFNERPDFANGFNPQFGGVVTDMSIAGGVRGKLESEWRYDASAVIGQHKSEFFL